MRNPLLGLALFVVAFALPELAFGQSRQSSYVWNQTSLTGNNLQADFGRIVAHPTNPNVIYLCTMSSLDPISGVPGPADGIWKSSDLGVTWTVLSDAVMSPDYSILGLAISESSPDTLYVSTKEYGVFKSTDGGISWAAMNNGLPFPNGNHSGVAIAVDPADADKVYVSVAQTDGLDIFNLSPDHPGFYLSHDGGASWQSNNTGLPSRYDNVADGNSRTAVPSSIVVLPQSPNYVLLGMAEIHVNTVLLFGSKTAKTSGKVFYSSNSGTGNFREASSGLPTNIKQGVSLGTSVARISASIVMLSNSTGNSINVWSTHTGLTFDIDLGGNALVVNRGQGAFFTKNGNWQARNAGLPFISSWTAPPAGGATVKFIDCTSVGTVAVGTGNTEKAVLLGSIGTDQGNSSSNNAKVYASRDSASTAWIGNWDAGLDVSPTLGYSEANAAGITFNADMSYAFATVRWGDPSTTTPLVADDGVYRVKLR
ncbi:MAG TPA: hypothetical protein QGG59_00255 [Planctomycetota bacterium]|jgi:hypothetical protein|nr:hypothetical protein [Planctomycetota bacterium]MDP7246284.1 hypothetical protein [Planctomycetota bacterium]HJM38527.1 hypothetical protein [Planctomycetota bacterium]|tara:strand:- start:11356 stop:12801 length:1446 start_codon:yes stop_codon:yes gene_type:complete